MWSRIMRDDECGKCSYVGVEKENDYLEMFSKPYALAL
jgi:hypothetical protein